MSEELARQVANVGALADPTRWSLYRYVCAEPEPVSREQACEAVELPLHTVKFHLDRLVDEGLLEVEYRRLSGRSGPGAGRPAKLYRRADRQVSITLPQRRYDLAGDLLAAAVDRSARTGLAVREALHEVARAAGVQTATEEDTGGTEAYRSTGAPVMDDDAARLVAVLSGHGYEPRLVESDLCLTNCPFDRLAAKHTELVCAMNLAFLAGIVEGLGAHRLSPRLEPEPGLCCVKVARTS